MGKETKNLMLEVSGGIVVFVLAVMLGVLFLYPKRSVFAGLFLGMVLALAMFLSMAVVLEKSKKMEEPGAIQRRCVISAGIRYVMLIAIMAAVIVRFSNWFHPIAVLIGILGLKAGAFLQPVIHKVSVRITKKV